MDEMKINRESETHLLRINITGSPDLIVLKSTLAEYWNMEALKITHLIGYDNSNYYIQAKIGNKLEQFVMKVFKNLSKEDSLILQEQMEVLAYLNSDSTNSNSIEFQYPRPYPPLLQPQKSSSSAETITKQTIEYGVLLLSYLPGTILDEMILKSGAEGEQQQNQIIINATRSLSSLTNKLLLYSQQRRSFKILEGRNWQWKMSVYISAQFYQSRLENIAEKDQRELIEYFVNDYKLALASGHRREHLRISVIHNDTNEKNLLVDASLRVRIFDFGDLAFSYTVEELAIFITYFVYKIDDATRIVEVISMIVSEYTKCTPLRQAQLEVLLSCITMRMCMSLLNSAHAQRLDPANLYISCSAANMWRTLKLFKDINLQELRMKIMRLGGLQHSEQVFENWGQQWGIEDQFWEGLPQPAFEEEQNHIKQLISSYFDWDRAGKFIEIQGLPGYVTKNYKITIATEEGLPLFKGVFKIYKSIPRLEEYSELVSKIVEFVHRQQKIESANSMSRLAVPLSIEVNKQAQSVYKFVKTIHDATWKTDVMIRMIEFVDGQTFSHYSQQICGTNANSMEAQYRSLVESMGEMLARMDRHLLKYYNEVLKIEAASHQLLYRKNYEWIIEHSEKWKKSIIQNGSPATTLLKYFYHLYQRQVGTKKPHLRKSVTHGDPNEDNTIVSEGRVCGFVDFDDVYVTFLIDDLAIAIAHSFHPITAAIKSRHSIRRLQQKSSQQEFLHFIATLIKKYHSTLPLQAIEVQCLYYLIGARLALCVANQMRDYDVTSSISHINYKIELELLYDIAEISPCFMQQLIMKELGMLKTEKPAYACPADYIHEMSAILGEQFKIKHLGIFDWPAIVVAEIEGKVMEQKSGFSLVFQEYLQKMQTNEEPLWKLKLGLAEKLNEKYAKFIKVG